MTKAKLILPLPVVTSDAATMPAQPRLISSASVARRIAGFVIILVCLTCAHSQTSSSRIPPSLFGNYAMVNNNWPIVPTGAFAGSSIKWVYLEQAKGLYTWSNLDAYVALANSHGVDFIWTYEQAPPWAVSDQSTCSTAPDGVSIQCSGTVTDLTGLRDFAVQLATRYDGNHGHGRIAAYQLQSEPDNFYTGTMAGLAAQVNTMHDAIRATDPQAKLVGIGLDYPTIYFAPGNYMDQWWAAGGTKDFDAVTFHGYPHHSIGDSSSETVNGYVAAIKAAFVRNGIASTMPIWDSEGSYGTSAYGTYDPNAQAGWLARSYLEHWSNGVSRYYWYGYDNSLWGTLWTSGGGLTLAGIAYQQVYNWMVGATMSTPCANAGTVWTCGLTLFNGAPALAVWNTAGSSSYSVAARYTTYRDLVGNTTNISGPVTIGIKPILLQGSIPQPPTGLSAVVQ